MIKLKTKSGRISKLQSWQVIIGSIMVFGAGFYTSLGLSPETAVIVMGIIKAVDTAITMRLRTITSESM